MAKGPPPADEERLPWLEPYRDAIAKAPPPKARPKKRGAGLVVGGVAAIAAALTAGYYIGQREAVAPPLPQPTRMAEAPVRPAPVAPPTPVPPPAPVVPAPVVEAPPPKAETSAARAPKKVAARKMKKPARRAERQRKIRSAGIESARLREVRAAQERAPAPRPVARSNYRPWPKMPSPGPAGQVIQLGAFKNPGRASAVYRTRLARYPVLASMPRVVVPVVTRPRGQVLYVLRLGTASRQQSRIVCRNLRISGDHCIVIG